MIPGKRGSAARRCVPKGHSMSISRLFSCLNGSSSSTQAYDLLVKPELCPAKKCVRLGKRWQRSATWGGEVGSPARMCEGSARALPLPSLQTVVLAAVE